MDVRCEKCQTEYELDEARLKPGGVTVKCTNCGHMFKIRKRSNTNVGAPPPDAQRPRSPSSKDSILGEDTAVRAPEGASDERQWLIRLENGEQKSCRELATLQQWIVAAVVTRESLISRSGKTWKRLGDIAELTQYFTIADEARTKRADKQTGKPAPREVPGTLLGLGAVSATGGTILPDDDLERRTTGSFKARPATTPPPVPGAKTPPMGSNATDAPAQAAPRRPQTQPPPPPAKKHSQAGPLPTPPAPQVPAAGNRSTGAWAADAIPTSGADQGPAGPLGGRVRTTSAEPAFAGRVRVMPTDESSFRTGKVELADDDDDLLPRRRGGRGGLLLAVLALLVMGGAAGVVYVFVIKKDKGSEQVVTPPPADAAVVAVVPDAAPVVSPAIDAPAAATPSPLDVARAELGPDLELKLRDAHKALEGNQDPGVEAVRAHLLASLAQALTDRASVTADKAEADKMRKDARTIVLEAATSAQRAFKATPDDAAANLAMAAVLRLQNKPARDITRYLDTAKAKASADWKRDVALADALILGRDGKLDDARAAFAAIDQGDDKLETSGDVRARFQLARIAYAQNNPTEAKPLVDQVLAAQPEHAAAKALAARIETTVAKTDPLPPEDPPKDAGAGSGSAKPVTPVTPVEPGGDSYDRLLAKANALAESNCTRAMELFGRALEQKPNGVEALTGMGYCHIDAKQFASAFSKFRAALAVSSRYEPALWGVGEAYQQQGRKDQAIDAFKAYLEVYPGSAKAQKALDRLGAGAGGGTPPDPGPGSGATEPTPTPTPTPTPPTPAPPEGAGSGSG